MGKKQTAAWNIQEKVVAIIEQYLDEKSHVDHDVKLPALSSASGKKRQCDVVIRQGDEPRQTISIVEVQKKPNKTVEINEFSGWLKKRDSVGAQHLICVSEKGFPDSVIEEAGKEGPSVRLLTLKDLEDDGWPFPSAMFNTELDIVNYEKINGLQAEGHHLMLLKHAGKEISNDPNDSLFRVPGSDRTLTAADLADWYLFNDPVQLQSIPADGTSVLVGMGSLWKEWGTGFDIADVLGKWVPLKRLFMQIRLSRHTEMISWKLSEYFQLDWGDGIAWAMRGDAEFNNKKLSIIIPLKKSDDGSYMHGRPSVIGDFEAFMQVGQRVFKAAKFDK